MMSFIQLKCWNNHWYFDLLQSFLGDISYKYHYNVPKVRNYFIYRHILCTHPAILFFLKQQVRMRLKYEKVGYHFDANRKSLHLRTVVYTYSWCGAMWIADDLLTSIRYFSLRYSVSRWSFPSPLPAPVFTAVLCLWLWRAVTYGFTYSFPAAILGLRNVLLIIPNIRRKTTLIYQIHQLWISTYILSLYQVSQRIISTVGLSSFGGLLPARNR